MVAAAASFIHLPRRKAYTETDRWARAGFVGVVVPTQTSLNIERSQVKINRLGRPKSQFFKTILAP